MSYTYDIAHSVSLKPKILSLFHGAEIYMAALICIFIILLAVVAFVITYKIKLDYDKRIVLESKAIANLKQINAKYTFRDIEPMYLEHRYDNLDFYNTVSERDYLVEKLTHIGDNVLKYIDLAGENKNIYSAYIREINEAKVFGLTTKFFFMDYANKRERVIFERAIKRPCTDFYITICLIVTKINDVPYGRKTKSFSANEIVPIINSVKNKYGEYYRDSLVWESICRVERAKVSNKMRFSIYERDGNRCLRCGSRYNLEIDHIFPISKGGKSVYSNLQTLCHDCNRQKSNTVEKSENSRYNTHGFYCPNCQVRLVMREGKYGKFYGCPNFPNCKYTKNL